MVNYVRPLFSGGSIKKTATVVYKSATTAALSGDLKHAKHVRNAVANRGTTIPQQHQYTTNRPR
jgi:hypothetical protein